MWRQLNPKALYQRSLLSLPLLLPPLLHQSLNQVKLITSFLESESADEFEDARTGEPENLNTNSIPPGATCNKEPSNVGAVGLDGGESGGPENSAAENATTTPSMMIYEEIPLSKAEGQKVLRQRLSKKDNLFRRSRKKQKKGTAASQPREHMLDIEHLLEVVTELYNLAPKWKSVGLALHLRPDVLNQIESDHYNVNDCLRETILLWLKRYYHTDRFGPPSWKLLVAAVGHPAGGNDPALAALIAEKHNLSLPNKDDEDDDDDEESQRFLEEAMKYGFVNVSVVKVVIVGTAGVGKTCLYYLLLSKRPPKPEDRTSTECAQRPVRVMQVGGKDGKWEEVDLKEVLAEAVPILCKRLKQDQPKSDETQGMQEDGEGSGAEGGKGAVGGMAAEEGTHEPNETARSEFELAVEEVVSNLTTLVTSHLAKGEKIDDIFLEKLAIYITDSGGQQAFWNLLPIFMYGPSATIFVHRLCDKMDAKPFNELYKNGKQVGQSRQRATITTAEAFQMMCQGLEVHDKSKLLLVGTHKDEFDKLTEADKFKETVDQKNEKIKNLVPEALKSCLVYTGEDLSKLIYEIDASNPKERENDIAAKIRYKVEESAEDHEVPIWWYMLQLILEEVARKLKRQVFTKRECEDLAESLGVEKDELEKALLFLDKLNLFFFKRILPGVVFASSQVPLNAVTELVTKHYELLAAKDNPSETSTPTDAMWLDFRDQAIITLRHLQDKRFQRHYKEGIFTASHFLELLEGLLIVAPISESKYFCPSLLEAVDVDDFLKGSTRITRVIGFPTGCAPPGVFCCAVCYLCSKAGWKILPEEIKRNQVTFSVDGIIVTFIDKFDFFSVSIDECNIDKDCFDQDDCRKLNNTMFQAITEALKTTHKETELFGLTFLCPCTEHATLHPATVIERKASLICTKTLTRCGSLNEKQKLFLSDATKTAAALECEPAMKDLSKKVVPHISRVMRSLGYQLELQSCDIDIIEHDYPRNVCTQSLKMFEKWRDAETSPFTWKVLLEALRAVELNTLARDLENWLLAASY